MNSFPAILFSVSCGGAIVITAAYKWKYKYIPTEHRRRVFYNERAPCYDRTVNRYEWAYGINSWRKQLARRAEGHVLEIGAGTCRNFDYFDQSKVSTVTCVDFSRPMLREGQTKTTSLGGIPVKFLCYNAVKLPFPDECFDTLIDTFGLCSYELPVEALTEALRCVKPGGKVLLLEHGISSWPLIRAIQEGFVERHASVWGCFNTRNILAILNLCPQLNVKQIKRKRFGTYLFIELEKQSHLASINTPEKQQLS